jgi:hypothetical protein
MLKLKDLESQYGVKINKVSNKYVIDNRTFTNLKDTQEYLEIKVKNDSIANDVKHKDYLKFKTILVNGKAINIKDCQFLDDLYGYINWYSIKKHHTVLSVTISENILLLNPNLFDNRRKTKMAEYQYLTRYGDSGNAKRAITRKELKVLNLEDIESIYVYGISKGTKYDIQCNYRKEVKQEVKQLAPDKHKDTISKANNHIAFNSNKSSVYSDNGIDYQLSLKDNKVYLTINNEYCDQAIGQYSFLSVPSIEYHYRHNGGAINDKEKKLTLGKIKAYLNNKQYSLLYSYLADSMYVDSYKKIMVKDEIVELRVKYFNDSIATFNLVKLDKTYLKIVLYPNYLDTVKQFLDLYSLQLDNIKTSLDFEVFKKEDELSKLDTIKDQKIENIHQKFKQFRIDLKKSFLTNYHLYNNRFIALEMYHRERKQLLRSEKDDLKRVYEELSLRFNSLSDSIDKSNLRIEKLDKTIQNLEITDYKSAIKKLTDSAMNSDNNKRLNHLLGSEHHETTKVYSVNSKIQITNSDSQKSKVSMKQIEKFTKKFITLLDIGELVVNDKTYQFQYFTTKINRNNPDNPFIEKIEISKQKLDKKILANFDNFMLELCLSNLNRLTSLPYIYPNKEDIKAWIKLNNYYLNKYGIEIMEVITTSSDNNVQ